MEPRPAARSYVESLFPDARIEAIKGDASTRSFFRIRPRDDRSRVLMDYGRPFENETDDVVMNRMFRSAGLPVASILASAPDPGCLVLEDLGTETLEDALERVGGDRRKLYEKAVDVLVAIATRGTEVLERSDRAREPALDAERFRFEMDFFLEHYAAGLARRRDLPPELERLLHDLADRAAETPRDVLCHRDFHSRNLMVRADGSLAMVDLQDARRGPDTYDIASLLRDAYVDLDEGEVERLLECYRRALPGVPDPEAFHRRFDVVAAQRMIKALGTFGYQAHRLGRRRYLDAVPRTVDRLRRLLPRRPETERLARVFEVAGLLSLP